MQIKKNSIRKYIFVAKADCYSCGFVLCKYVEKYVDMFAVFSLEEAIILREIGIKKDILLLSYNLCEIKKYVAYNLQCNIYRYNDLIIANDICSKINKQLKVHFPIDTGMNRFGEKNYNNCIKCINFINSSSNLMLGGLYTHFYCSNKVISNYQYKLFKDFIINNKLQNKTLHYISSNYIIHFNKIVENEYCRIGIANYIKTVQSTIDCIDLYSKIINIKELALGESVGYDIKFVAKQKTIVAVCSGGYFDGINSSFVGYKVKVNNKYCKIIGSICMDVFFIDITNCRCKIGDLVNIISSTDDNISIENLANYSKLSMHELLVNMRGRIKTIYKKS